MNAPAIGESTLDFAALRAVPVIREPFQYLIAHDVIRRDRTPAVLRDFPQISNTGSFPLSEVTYGPAFGALAADLTGPEFSQVMSECFHVDLSPFVPFVTVRGRVGPKDGAAHTDSKWKVLTVLLYLNEHWDNTGGQLRLLRDEDLNHPIVEIPPTAGTMLAFLRADNSWHGHLPAEGERRVVQLNWAMTQDRVDSELRRHRRTAWLKRLVRH